MHINSGFNYWVCNDHGSIADWVSGIGTIGAIMVGFHQVKVQNQLERARIIENKRPRFDVKSASALIPKNNVLAFEHDASRVKEIVEDYGDRYFKLQMTNISENIVYDLAVRFIYVNSEGKMQNDFFSFNGLKAREKLILIPTNHEYTIKPKRLIIKYTSSVGEEGFCDYNHFEKSKNFFEQPNYYFVMSNNKYMSGYEIGKMISKKSKQFKKLNFESKYLNNRFSFSEKGKE